MDVLSEDNFDRLLTLLAASLSHYVEEAMINQIEFTLLGAMQFDNDIRSIVHFFSVRSKSRIRDRFVRIIEGCSLLTCETLIDVLQLIKRKDYVLNEKEIKKILNRRQENGFIKELQRL